MDEVDYLPIDDDPYSLDDEPKITASDKVDADAEEITIVNINFESVDYEIEKNEAFLHNVPTNKETSLSYDTLDDMTKDVVTKKPKKRTNVWTKTNARKGSKKPRPLKFPHEDKNEKTYDIDFNDPYLLEEKDGIHLSKVVSSMHADQKAEKVELSLDKLQASSEKGYRMVRATRGVSEGAWYYEIIVKSLGKTGHTRLGWSTWKGDLQAPVGFDCNSYAYRDVDGSKVHKALREPYGKAYFEGDVVGFYINLPNGADYTPNNNDYVHKASKCLLSTPLERKECLLKRVPGSEISFYKNGEWQGVAYKDILGGEYFPAASMYTLPSPEKKCCVQFNFGPDYICPPKDWNGCPIPQPMSKALPPKNIMSTPLEPSPRNNRGESKKWISRTKTNGMQRMTAKCGSRTIVEDNLLTGNESVCRTKRTSEEQDKGKRIRVYGKKGYFGRGRKTIGLFPCPVITKPRIYNVSQHRKLIKKNCENIVKVPIAVNMSVESSDEETE